VILLKNKFHSIKSVAKTKRGKRQYANPEATLLTHPTRMKIIDSLKSGHKSTTEIESLVGENRINLYHHLNLLESENIISSTVINRQKMFRIAENKFSIQTQVLVLSIPNSIEIKKMVIKSLSDIIRITDSNIEIEELNDLSSLNGKKIIIEFT